MKRFLILLPLLLIFSFIGCSKEPTGPEKQELKWLDEAVWEIPPDILFKHVHYTLDYGDTLEISTYSDHSYGTALFNEHNFNKLVEPGVASEPLWKSMSMTGLNSAKVGIPAIDSYYFVVFNNESETIRVTLNITIVSWE